MVNFNRRLYPYAYELWYRRFLHDRGYLVMDKPFHQIDVRNLQLPGWFPDSRDQRLRTRTAHDADIPPHSFTLASLPTELQVDPENHTSFINSPMPTLESIAERISYQRKLKQTAGNKSTSSSLMFSSSSSSSSSSLSSSLSSSSSWPWTDEIPELENENRGFKSEKRGREVKQEKGEFWRGMRDASAAYQDPRRALQTARNEEAESNRMSLQSGGSSQGVLGNILEVLDPHTRARVNITKNGTRSMDAAAVARRMRDITSRIHIFKGEAEKAPKWFLEYCQEVECIPYTPHDAFLIMSNTLQGEAEAWFTSVSLTVSTLPIDQVIPTLLGLFREKYMGEAEKSLLRRRITDRRANTSRMTVDELSNHYTAFMQDVNNLRVCDRTVKDTTFGHDFVQSLPYQLRLIVLARLHGEYSVDEAYNAAREALRTLHVDRTSELNPDKARKVFNLNTISAVDYGEDEDQWGEEEEVVVFEKNKDIQHEWFFAYNYGQQAGERMKKDDISCWHCGVKGHCAGECARNLAGEPQTTQGARVFAEFNKARGEVRPYDAKKQIEQSTKYRERSVARSRGRGKGRGGSSYGRGSASSNGRVEETRPKPAARKEAILALQDEVDECELEEEDDEDDGSDGLKRVVHITMLGLQQRLEEVHEREKQEAESSSLLCLPLEVNGQSVGYALSDQGATKTCIRASALERLGLEVEEHPVHNYSVIGSTGEEVPIRSRFSALLTTQGRKIGHTLVYVVDNTSNNDIICDMVMGRSTMSTSNFNCIDTKKGTLFNKETKEEIQCLPARFINTGSQGHIIPTKTRKAADKGSRQTEL